MNILIIGCGYIGSKAAKIWTEQGHSVTATTRSAQNLAKINDITQKAIVLKGSNTKELAYLIKNQDVILVSVAAKSPEEYRETYLNTSQAIRKAALSLNSPKSLIYTSSGMVYGNHHGLWVDETSNLLGKTDEAKILIQAEKTYLSLMDFGWNVCIFRLAEIYGPDREISKRLRESESRILPGNGQSYTNMIHVDDVVAALDYAIKHHLSGIYNVVDDVHTVRKDLYNQLCKEFKLPEVTFDPSLSGMRRGNKRLSNHKLKASGYKLRYPERQLS